MKIKIFSLVLAMCVISSISFSQELSIGDKVLLGNGLTYEVDDYFKKNWNDSSYNEMTVWTAIKQDSTDILFRNKYADSFWLTKYRLAEKIANYKFININHYNRLVKKYGQSNCKKSLKGITWIGMPEALLLIAAGQPKEINRTKTANATSAQWVYTGYKTKYFYLTNGKVTAIQD